MRFDKPAGGYDVWGLQQEKGNGLFGRAGDLAAASKACSGASGHGPHVSKGTVLVTITLLAQLAFFPKKLYAKLQGFATSIVRCQKSASTYDLRQNTIS